MRISILVINSLFLLIFFGGCKDLLTKHDIDLDGVKHGTKLYKGVKNCTSCHGISLNGSFALPGCYECHKNLWSKDFHTKDRSGVLHHSAFPPSSDNCGNCHGGSSLQGKRSRPSCYSCHGDNWSALASHTDNQEGYLHGSGKKNPTANCAGSACHGSSLTGGHGPSCYSCHGEEWD